MNIERQRFGLGITAALAVVGIWSGFIVVARFGVTHTLTIYDVAALRFGFAGLISLPFAFLWWPRRLPLWKCLALAAGPGAPYALLAYAGMTYAPVTHAAVFLNGALPVFTLLLAFLVLRETPGIWKVAGAALVLAGCALLAFSGSSVYGPDLWIGYLFLLAASLVLAAYMLNTRMWGLRPRELLALVPVLNGALFVPVWLAGLPSNLAAAPWSEILLQMLYQGLGPSLIAVPLFMIAIKNLGSTPTAALMAGVPAVATLIAIPTLGEFPNSWEWTGMVVVTVGILTTLKKVAGPVER